jgi:hypothetical protein
MPRVFTGFFNLSRRGIVVGSNGSGSCSSSSSIISSNAVSSFCKLTPKKLIFKKNKCIKY